MNQDELRQKAKCLKWMKDISYKDISAAIGMEAASFYNFLNNKEVKLGYKRQWMLQNYLEGKLNE